MPEPISGVPVATIHGLWRERRYFIGLKQDDAQPAVRLIVGFVLGLTGGGFLIVPALVLIASLPMRQAVATSLWVIAIISALGFASHVLAGARLDLELTASFVGGGLGGMALGIGLGRRLAGPTLQKLFAGMIVAVATFMLARLAVG